MPALVAPPNFRTAAREVDNWRREAALALDLPPEPALSLAAGDTIRGLSRCVRLNNYWCIKRAGWSGEIAADGEGHVAFASAREGAAVAALLLRRYYVDFGLKTARAIVSRWAPAQCGTVAQTVRVPRVARSDGAPGSGRAAVPNGLAQRGIGNTLRARWLATHTIGGLPRFAGVRRPAASRIARAVPQRSVVPDRLGPSIGTPIIMAGLGTPSREPVRLAMLPYPGTAMGPTPGARSAALPTIPSLPTLPPTSCVADGARIANYAAKTAEGIVAGPLVDLALFDAQGKPTANLAKVMANMAAVEIGPLRASDAVIAAGIAAVAARNN